MDDTNNKELNPTVPTKNIFEANQIPKPERDTSAALDSASSPQVSMKKEIVVRHRRFPSGIVFGLIGIVVLLLVVAFIAKIIASRNAMNGPITLTWWSIEEDSDALTPIISEYEQQHPNIKIQFVSESKQDYALRLTNALANGKGPDIFEFHNTWVPMFAGNLSFVKDNFSSIFYPVVTTNLKTNSGFVGIPLEYDGIALFVNNDILNTYGKNPPKTWDDFRSLAQTLTVRDSSGVIQQGGAGIGVTTNVDYWQDVLGLLLLQNGTDPTTPFSTFGSSALTFYTNFSKTDHVWDSTLPSSTLDFSTGHLGMYFGKYSDVFNIQKQNPNLHFEVVPLPQLPDFNRAATNSIAYASYWVNGVSKTSTNTAAAWDFLKFMSSASALRELYTNEKKVRGYGNLYPRPDMQQEILSDTFAGPFIYQANFARSWYLVGNTNDGLTGINSQVAKSYGDAIDGLASGNSTADQILKSTQANLTQILSSYGLVAPPSATP